MIRESIFLSISANKQKRNKNNISSNSLQTKKNGTNHTLNFEKKRQALTNFKFEHLSTKSIKVLSIWNDHVSFVTPYN